MEKIDRREIVKKLLLKPVDWITMSPFLAGTTIGMMAWALNADTGLTIGASAALIFSSLGIYLQRLIFGWSDNERQLIEDLRHEIESRREQELDKLYQDLLRDGDPRTETILKDLRVLTKALTNDHSDVLQRDMGDILFNIEVLTKKCVEYLSESYQLWDTASKMQNRTIKQQLLAQREVFIKEVEKSLENFGALLGRVKQTSLSGNGQQLADLREELSDRLRIAEEVDIKMKEMRYGSMSEADEQKFLQAARQVEQDDSSLNQEEK